MGVETNNLEMEEGTLEIGMGEFCCSIVINCEFDLETSCECIMERNRN